MHPGNKSLFRTPVASRFLLSNRGRSLAVVLALLFLAGWVAEGAWVRHAKAQQEVQRAQADQVKPSEARKILYYVSPMDPEYKSDKPGKAPCGMDLVPVYEGEGQPPGTAAANMPQPPAPEEAPKAAAADPGTSGSKPARERKILYYVDPMNPTQKSDKPGKAPCGMDLVAVYEEEDQSVATLPRGTVKISPQKQQLIGVKLGEVAERPLTRNIRAVGKIGFDETRTIHVHSKFPGWIVKAHVNFTGREVKKGELLAEIASTDFVSFQQELLLAKKSSDRLKNSSFEGISATAASLYESAKKRLQSMDVTEAQIAEIERQGAPADALLLYSPTDGFVLSRHAFEGQHVSPETELYSIADTSTIWVLADIYEHEVPAIKQGQAVTVSLPYSPGRNFGGIINYVYPRLDPQTRTLKVRIELPNPELELKPDMFANVDINVDQGKLLAVPREAVLDSGSAQTVFVAREQGYFEPRKVKLGQQVDGFYVVLDGLEAGERVVTSGQFLIDSESQIKSATGGMSDSEADKG